MPSQTHTCNIHLFPVFTLLKYPASSKPQVKLFLTILVNEKSLCNYYALHGETTFLSCTVKHESRTLRSTHVEGLFNEWLLSITE